MKKIFTFVFLIFTVVSLSFAYGDKKIYIWDGVKADGVYKTVTPMYLFKAKNTEGKTPAVIICPGGSYHHHGMYNEGSDVAKWFTSKGFTAFVLKYRTNAWGYTYPAIMQDLQRAIQLVRENADEYGIDAANLGIIGFSAGGHLVAWQAEHYARINLLEDMGIHTEVSLEPSWVCPVYPVVSMQDDIYHHWSRFCLTGTTKPTQEKKDMLSLELQVPDKMPPVYLVACHDDNVVNFENSARLYKAMKAKNIDVTFAEYEKGGHGFGMLNNKFMKEQHWNESLYEWLKQKGFAK
ncbi:MAG: alpha/beta hydrolase [Treponema sp.]|nr:alpha/beta hydrolase [Treponema sp.]MBQ4237458.1 alpha/beta hydrolase [Treponema sp.]MBQ5382930.1 alpha/beta hydrolase [Treponema sp.]